MDAHERASKTGDSRVNVVGVVGQIEGARAFLSRARPRPRRSREKLRQVLFRKGPFTKEDAADSPFIPTGKELLTTYHNVSHIKHFLIKHVNTPTGKIHPLVFKIYHSWDGS